MNEGTPASGAHPRYHHGDLRKALIAAAEEELKEKGSENFSLRGAAKRAGVSHAAPAHHFRDTVALLTALAAEGFERLSGRMEAYAEEAPDDPDRRLIAIGLAYIDFALANPALFKLMFGSDRRSDDDAVLREKAGGAFALLVRTVGDARGGGNPLAEEAGAIQVATAWSVVHGLAHLLIDRKMDFLQGALEQDRVAALTRVIAPILQR